MTTPITTVLFDWGHTLFDTAGSLAFIERRSAELGHPLGRDIARRLHTEALAASRTAEELAKGRDKSLAVHRDCWLALWSDLESACPGLAADLWTFETSAAGWMPYPDAVEVMEELRRRGIRIAVLSDVPFDLRPIFDHYGMRHLAEEFFLSGEHGTVKAERELFRIAMRTLGVEPGECLMVGDNNANDGFAIHEGIRTWLMPHVPSGSPRGLADVLRLVG